MEHLKSILFIDIETVPMAEYYNGLTEPMQKEWNRKAKLIKNAAEGRDEPSALFEDRAGVFSEFAKVVVIGIGYLAEKGGKWVMRLKSLAHEDEKILLTQFLEIIDHFSSRYKDFRFCGHNIKEFDIPFLCRRLLINGLPLPSSMNVSGKKPWEVNHIDTMEMWRFGDYKNFTSLSLLAAVFGIPSPKEDIDGSMVAGVFYKEKDLPRIAKYCMQDVYTSAKVYLRLSNITDIQPEAEYVA